MGFLLLGIPNIPSGAIGVWYASSYETSPRKRIVNAITNGTADPNLLSGPRRLFNSPSFWSTSGTFTLTDNNGTAPDGSNDASSVVVTAGNDWSIISNPGSITLPNGTYKVAVSVKLVSGAATFNFGDTVTGTQQFTATSSWQRFSKTVTVAGGSISLSMSSGDHTSAQSLLICDWQMFSGSSDLNALMATPVSVQNADLILGKSTFDTASVVSSGAFQNGSTGLVQFSSGQALSAFTVVYLEKRSAAGTSAQWQPVVANATKASTYSLFSVGEYLNLSPGSFYNGTEMDTTYSGNTQQQNGNLIAQVGAGPFVGASRYDGTTAATFINGVKLFTHTVSVAAPTVRDLAIGVLQETLFSGYDKYAVAIYARALSDAEILQAYRSFSSITSPTTPRTAVFEGSSLTAGQAGLSYAYVAGPNLTPSLHGIVGATSGASLATLVTRAASLDAIINTSVAQKYILSVEAGVNDIGMGFTYAGNPNGFTTALASYLDARRAAGWTVVVHTVLSRTDQADGGTQMDADRAVANPTIRSWVGVHCDAVADIASDSIIGINGASNNTTYFSADKVHLIDAGYVRWEPYTTLAINGL